MVWLCDLVASLVFIIRKVWGNTWYYLMAYNKSSYYWKHVSFKNNLIIYFNLNWKIQPLLILYLFEVCHKILSTENPAFSWGLGSILLILLYQKYKERLCFESWDQILISFWLRSTEAEFEEFEPRLKYGWFHLKFYLIFQDLSRRSIETGFRGI